MKTTIRTLCISLSLLIAGASSHAATGKEGASFLNTPVGAEPAAMAGAYSALATDAYAPVWNPGGLGFVQGTQMTAQYLASLETLSDTHVGFVHPMSGRRSLGASLRYLGSGKIASTDKSGNSAGTFSSHYGAYGLSYGRAISHKMSVGLTGKIIEAKIADVSAKAYAVDLGSYYQATSKLTLAGVVTNLGSKMKFISQRDPLPLAFHAAGAYKITPMTTAAIEGVYHPVEKRLDMHSGIEWNPSSQISLRLGYRTDTLETQSPLAGLTTGIGLKVFGQTLSYAWLPLGDLGSTQYVSLVMRFNNNKPAQ